MATNLPIRDIPGDEGTPNAAALLAMDNGVSMLRTTVKKVVDAGAPVASQAEAEAGSDNDKRMTALRTKQFLDSQIGATIASAAQGALAAGAAQKDQNLADLASAATARTNLGLGTAAVADASDFADAAQGALADTSLQPADIGSTIASAAQGALADTSLQPDDIGTTAGKVAAGDDGRFALAVSALQPDDIGTGNGKIVARELFEGVDAIYTAEQTVFTRREVGLGDAVDWQFLRRQNTAGPDTTFGFVNANLVAATTVDATSDQSEWTFLTKLDVNAPSNWAQHVSAYHQTIKSANANSWALCTEMRDLVPNTTHGSIAFENGIFVAGTDNNNQRVALHIPIDRHSSQTGTNHEVSRGLWITPDSGNVKVKWGVELKGKFDVGIDLTGMNVAHSDKAIELAQDQLIRWRDGYHGSVEKGALGWHSAINTWLISGALLTSAAPGGGAAGALPANPVTYVNMQINGVMLKIPAYS